MSWFSEGKDWDPWRPRFLLALPCRVLCFGYWSLVGLSLGTEIAAFLPMGVAAASIHNVTPQRQGAVNSVETHRELKKNR